jgi:sigma-B regulation protein RsbU (phosphoserine phosphatase)
MAHDNDLGRLREENERLKEAIEELTILNDIATAIGSAMSLDEIMELIIQKCLKHFGAEQGAIMVLDPSAKDRPFHTVMRKADRSDFMLRYRLDAQLVGWMLKHRKPLMSKDLRGDARFTTTGVDDSGIRSLLSVPLLLKGRMIGVLNVFNKRAPEGFSDADQRLLAIIATESAQVIENTRLSEEEQALLHMQEEMRLAYKIQADLLPKSPPRVEGYDIAGMSIPAKEVGGDYFDFIVIDDRRLGFCLGDVSGKGMPAALLMANLQATLRSNVLQDLTPCECLRRSNESILRSTDIERFATLFYGVLDSDSHKLVYCNAGHNFPVLLREGDERMTLDVGGTVLGTFADACYIEGSAAIDPGDALVVYSDGITDSVNSDDEEFGDARLCQVAAENLGGTAAEIIEAIMDNVGLHTGGESPLDDMTLVVIKRME